jgi:hypothetical protein
MKFYILCQVNNVMNLSTNSTIKIMSTAFAMEATIIEFET